LYHKKEESILILLGRGLGFVGNGSLLLMMRAKCGQEVIILPGCQAALVLDPAEGGHRIVEPAWLSDFTEADEDERIKIFEGVQEMKEYVLV
jgi:hypothetical protein